MNTPLKNLSLLGLLGLFAVGVTGCDADDPVDPPDDGVSTIYDDAFDFDNDGAVDGVRVQDRGEGTGTTTWSADNTYYLDGFVFVNSGQTLTIEPGTVVKGLPGEAEDASALIVARGGRIEAAGTQAEPIVFTAATDDVEDPSDIPAGTRGLWGGVIVLGEARTNTTPSEVAIEGIPTTEARGLYGGTNDADDSGTLRYISIRYGGSDIGAGNEINGLTLGAVGSGTEIDYVEVIFNADDGVEWFGGSVNTKHLVVAFVGDDSYDYDQGFRGNGQFWFTIQDAGTGNRAGEHDGGDGDLGGEDATPYAIPVIANATYIGSGAASANDDNDQVLEIRDNAGAKYYASVFTDFAEDALRIEDLPDAGVEDSRARFEAGGIELIDNVWFGFGGGADLEAVIDLTEYDDDDNDATPDVEVDPAFRTTLADYLAGAGNRFGTDPMLRSICRTTGTCLDPRPAPGSVLLNANPTLPTGSFFQSVSYIGAFGDTNWLQGWTALDQLGYLAN
ncbi:MAG: T9SS C-terminal target domain-containing protein [Rubricoccaceae bacterium]|nr:T9SS C-terminal target domain-containing protein [Rubricoccaceae bacterium]